jgi:hypothetical protein
MRAIRPTRALALAFATAALTAFLGCSSGPATGDVEGKVTFKGQPVTEGTVTLLNATQGGAAEGQLGPDGRFSIPKVVVGEYVVVVNPPTQMADTDPGKSPPAPVEKPVKNIPMKYRQQGTTDLKAAVKEGKNEVNLDLRP